MNLIEKIKTTFTGKVDIDKAIKNGAFYQALKEASIRFLRAKKQVDSLRNDMKVNKAYVRELLEMVNERKVAIKTSEFPNDIILVIHKKEAVSKTVPAKKIAKLEQVLRSHGINPNDFIETKTYPPTIDIRTVKQIPKGKGKNKPWDGKVVELD